MFSATGLLQRRPLLLACLLAGTGLLSAAANAAGFPSDDQAVPLDSVCLAMTGGNVDATRPAANRVPNDVVGAATQAGGTWAAYYGLEDPYRALLLDVGSAGMSGTLDWYYWSSIGAWRPVDAPRGAPALTESGESLFRFARPDDWATHAALPECGGTLYYVRATTAAPYDVPPLLTRVSAVV